MYAHTVLTQLPFQLTYAFDERQRLDVTHRTTDLRDHKVKLILRSQQFYVTFDLIGNMRNYLYCFTQVITFTFFIYYALINTAGRNVVRPCSRDIQETFVVS